MEKSEFKARWESDEIGGGITFDNIASCAIEWGVTRTPRTMPMDLVLYRVLKAAGTIDAEDFAPQRAAGEGQTEVGMSGLKRKLENYWSSGLPPFERVFECEALLEELWAEFNDTERQLREWKAAYTRDIAAAATRLREAQERSEYWKAEHLAGNREIDTLKERCERLEGAINEAFDCATLGHAENVLRDALTPGASDEPR